MPFPQSNGGYCPQCDSVEDIECIGETEEGQDEMICHACGCEWEEDPIDEDE